MSVVYTSQRKAGGGGEISVFGAHFMREGIGERPLSSESSILPALQRRLYLVHRSRAVVPIISKATPISRLFVPPLKREEKDRTNPHDEQRRNQRGRRRMCYHGSSLRELLEVLGVPERGVAAEGGHVATSRNRRRRLLGEPHALFSHPRLCSHQSLHAPQRHVRLLPDVVTPHQGLQLYQPLQSPQCPPRLHHHPETQIHFRTIPELKKTKNLNKR